MASKILVVDDQPGIRMLLKDILSEERYSVDEGETGQEAIVLVRIGTYDLIILDYKLPVIDGVDVLKQLEAESIHLPAILITGLVEEIDQDVADFPLVEEIVAKPFNIEYIQSVVNNILYEQSI